MVNLERKCHGKESHPPTIERKSALSETKKSDNETPHPLQKNPNAVDTVAVPEIQQAPTEPASAEPDAGAQVSATEPASANNTELDVGAKVSSVCVTCTPFPGTC